MRRATSCTDPARSIPAHAGAREDALRAALTGLRAEHARLERMGIEPALTLCREQLRFWQFLDGMFSLPPVSSLRSWTTRGTGRP